MYFRRHIPLLKFLGTCIVPVVYIVGFATKHWVKTDTVGWGLWNWCYINFTDLDNPADYVNDTQRCHVIAPAESSGYFEAVRVIAIFALVTFVAFFFTIGDNRHMGKGNRPTAIAIAAASLTTVVVVLLASTYNLADERWKLDPSSPALDWSFALVAASVLLSLCMAMVFWKAQEIRMESLPYLASNGAVLPNVEMQATGGGHSGDSHNVVSAAADKHGKDSAVCEEPTNPDSRVDVIGDSPRNRKEQQQQQQQQQQHNLRSPTCSDDLRCPSDSTGQHDCHAPTRSVDGDDGDDGDDRPPLGPVQSECAAITTRL